MLRGFSFPYLKIPKPLGLKEDISEHNAFRRNLGHNFGLADLFFKGLQRSRVRRWIGDHVEEGGKVDVKTLRKPRVLPCQ